ncbi:uncharacterized protein [Narcine bancroftii]|uniref:uncharacterized protein n=1 Tax=Narcine bancroftii TaxID=1343680 RepID=UPI003831B4C5
MSPPADHLLHRILTSLGFSLLLTGTVTLTWLSSSPGTGSGTLRAASLCLCVCGAATLLLAAGLGLVRRLRTLRESEVGGEEGLQPTEGAEEPRRRRNRSLTIPPCRTIVTDVPGLIWTISGPSALTTPLETPPPLYETVVQEPQRKGAQQDPSSDGVRRLGSESDAERLVSGSSRPLEPLTPPPSYEPGPSGTFFTFQVEA